MAAQPAESSPGTSDFENVSPDNSANAGESDWTEADVSSAAGGMSRGESLSGALQPGITGQPAAGTSQARVEAQRPAASPAARAPSSAASAGRDLGHVHGGGGPKPSVTPEGDKSYSTLKEIEDAGHKVADFTKTAASDLSKKLFGREGGGDEAFSISRLTEGVSSWWSALDTSSLSPEAPSRQTAASQVQSDAQLFGLPATEAVLEAFARCTLVQTYTCTHNNYTPDREVGWQGRLVITDQHTCWRSDGAAEDAITLMLPHGDVSAVQKVSRGTNMLATPLVAVQNRGFISHRIVQCN